MTLERSYRLLSTGRLISFPAIAVGLCLTFYVTFAIADSEREARVFLYLLPVALVVMLGPVFGLGGTLHVRADHAALRFRRDRYLGIRGNDVVIAAPARVTVQRYGGRHRGLGRLWVEAADGRRVQVSGTAWADVLAQIERDLDQA